MKKILVIAAVTLAVGVMQALATVSIDFQGAYFYDNAGNAVSSASGGPTALMVVDEAGLGSPTLNLTAGASDVVGATIGGHWLVVAQSDFSLNGTDGLLVFGDDSATLVKGTFTTGQAIDILWFPDTPSTQTTLNPGYYGSITEPSDLSGGDPWAVPGDGSGVGLACTPLTPASATLLIAASSRSTWSFPSHRRSCSL